MIIKKTKDFIRQNNLINKNDSIIVGFSGGPDSVFLLYLLNEIKEEYDLKIIAVHLNHMIRDNSAKKDEEFSKMFARNLGVDFVSYKRNIPKYAKNNNLSTEDAGRRIRYEIFNKEASKLGGASKIAVGHHKDDLVETVFMNFIRGAGSNGLVGIKEKVGNIIRPLLNLEKNEIINFLKENQVPYVEDKSNFQNDYRRNKIRNELIPYIKDNFNPNIVDGIVNMSSIIKEEQKFIEDYTSNLNFIKEKNDEIIVDSNILSNEHKAVQRLMIIKAYEILNGSRKDLSYENIESILELLKKDSASFIIKDYKIYIYNKKLYFTKIKKKSIFEESIFNIGDTIEFNNYKIKSEIVDNSRDLEKNRNIAYFNMDILDDEIKIRTRKSGDLIKLEGFTKKTKDIFIDRKIDKNKRDEIPNLIFKENILWLMGIRRSSLYKITDSMKKIIKISLERADND